MRRNIFILVFLTLSVIPFFNSVRAEQKGLIPITVGDVKKSKEMTAKERMHFIADYYLKNKENGASDEEILNEILKLIDLDDKKSEEIKKLSLIGKRYKDLQEMAKDAIEQANMTILEKNPGRTDMLIDLDKRETWKNIKNIYVGKTRLEEFFKVFKGNPYFSKVVSSKKLDALLASCANIGRQDVYMHFILFPRDNSFFIMQEEGRSPDGFQVDFSGSENLIFEPIFFPMESVITLNGKKYYGYKEKVYLPFKTRLKNIDENAIVHAKITVNVCKDNVCQKEVMPDISYILNQATFESSICPNIVKQYSTSPKSQTVAIKLKDAFFKKENNGDIYFVAYLKLPMFVPTEVSSILKNEQGLHFADPLLIKDRREFLVKARLLNPEQLKEKATVTLAIQYPNSAAEFEITAVLKHSLFESNISLFSFSAKDFIKTFFMGIKFFALTPVFWAFIIFLYQMFAVSRKTEEKTLFFYDGLKKAFFFICIASLIFLFIVKYFSLPNHLFWGIQFGSPLACFAIMLIFIAISLNWKKLFDDVSVEVFSRFFTKFFLVSKTADIREKAGVITGLLTGLLLLITPMTTLYFQVYELLSRSAVLYSLSFAIGVALPFFVFSLLSEWAANLEESEDAERFMTLVSPLPLLFQILILLLSIGSLAGADVSIIIVLVISAAGALIWKNEAFKNKGIMIVALIGVFLVPLRPTDKNLNNWKSVSFDEALLRQRVKEGKSVYLNVTEDFCLSCLWNKFLMVSRGAPEQIKNGELTIMRVGYADPFLKRLVPKDNLRSLPMNIIFSPKYPEGKIVDAKLKMWSVANIAEEALPVKKIETDPEMWLARKKPKPAEKDKD